MSFDVQYHESVLKEDIPNLPKAMKVRIKAAIEDKLMDYPEKFGKPLRRSLKNYRNLRVGDDRVIYRIENIIVKIFLIQHRAVVYKYARHRIHQ